MKKLLRIICVITIFYFGTTRNFVMSCFDFSIKKKIALNAFKHEFSGRDWHTGDYWIMSLSDLLFDFCVNTINSNINYFNVISVIKLLFSKITE